MPFFDYECTECGSHFEVMHRAGETPSKECKRCGGELRKLATVGGARPRKGETRHVRGADDVLAPWSSDETEIHRGWKGRRKWKHEALGWTGDEAGARRDALDYEDAAKDAPDHEDVAKDAPDHEYVAKDAPDHEDAAKDAPAAEGSSGRTETSQDTE